MFKINCTKKEDRVGGGVNTNKSTIRFTVNRRDSRRL